ncbi:MAG: hypothetical protein GY804_01955 [Alphaproteobacteria bacterium]|nr:hypothetical protein [Alphaproteobacteria bacterium]
MKILDRFKKALGLDTDRLELKSIAENALAPNTSDSSHHSILKEAALAYMTNPDEAIAIFNTFRKAADTVQEGIDAKRDTPEKPVLVIASEADKAENITKVSAGIEIPKTALDIKRNEMHNTVHQLARNLQEDLANNGEKTTPEARKAELIEQHGLNTIVIHETIKGGR